MNLIVQSSLRAIQGGTAEPSDVISQPPNFEPWLPIVANPKALLTPIPFQPEEPIKGV